MPKENEGHPAWESVLGDFPDEYHDKLKEHFTKWDEGVQQGYQKVHSDYAPFKKFVDDGLTPEDISAAIGFVNLLQEDPKGVYDRIGSAYNFGNTSGGSGQGQQQQNTANQEEEIDPRFAKIDELEQQLKLLASHVVTDREARTKQLALADAEAKLDQELSSLKESNKHKGDFDEEFVLGLMSHGMSGQEAVDRYYERIGEVLKKHQVKPLMLGGGSAIPGASVDVRKLNPKDRRAYAVQVLQNRLAQREG